jgi:hypothetical protein
MSIFQDCPLAPELTDIPSFDCPENFDQVEKIVLFREQAESGLDWFGTETDLQTEADWDVLLAKTDAEKIMMPPFINNVVIPQSEEQTEGRNDNTTIGGIELYLGESFTKVTGDLKGAPSDVKRAMKKLTQYSLAETGLSNLKGMLLLRNNRVLFTYTEADQTIPRGFYVFNMSISDTGSEGLNAKNVNGVRWAFECGWDDWRAITTPDFIVRNK